MAKKANLMHTQPTNQPNPNDPNAVLAAVYAAWRTGPLVPSDSLEAAHDRCPEGECGGAMRPTPSYRALKCNRCSYQIKTG